MNWNSIPVGTDDTLYSIYFTDVNSGYACGTNGRIIKTTDAGQSWFNQNSGVNFLLKGIFFLNPDKGFICGHGVILKTTNGGNNWTTINTGGSYNAITFINANTGFAPGGITGGQLRKTTNGGNTWLNYEFQSIPKAITSIQFLDASTGFMSGNNSTYLKTTNTGLNWTYNNTITAEGYNLASLNFPNSNEGYLVGTYGTIFKTTDIGNTWVSKCPKGSLEDFYQVTFPNHNTGYTFASSSNALYKTTNEGNNWTAVKVPFEIFKIQFFDGNTGIAVGSYFLLKTVNGGKAWNYLPLPDSAGTWQFLDVNTGFSSRCCSYDDYFYKTTNGGLNWSTQPFYNSTIYDFEFPSHNIGYMFNAWDTSKLLKTTNNGNNWLFVRNLDFDSSITRDLHFINENTGFISGFIPDPFVQETYELFKTTDGGIHWDFNSSYGAYIKIKFFDENTGFLISNEFIGSENKIYKTTNQGNNWVDYHVGERRINDIEFIDDNTGYVVGNVGLIKKTTTGGSVFIENNSSTVPSGFTLYQNYPNPFNPETVISYSLKRNSFVTLRIFDILGKEINSLINEKQNTGSYSVNFNGKNLPSGIYFYKLQAGNFSKTRKMVMVK